MPPLANPHTATTTTTTTTTTTGNGQGNGNGHGHGHGKGHGNGNNNGSGNGNNPKPPTNSLPTVPNQVSLPTIKCNETLTILSSMLLAGTADANNDVLRVKGLSASSGTLERVSANEWTFTPNPDDIGSVQFGFRVSDGKGSVAHKATTTVQAAVVEDSPPPTTSPDSCIGTEAADTIMGDGVADFQITLTGSHELTESHFIF